MLPFAWHALTRGVGGLRRLPDALGYFAGPIFSEWAIFVHMVLGGAVTLLALVQLAGPRPWPALHRLSGRCLAILAVITAIGGLAYIGLRGTVGGAWMSAAFALYGALMLLAAVQAPRFALASDMDRHRRWGLRLIVLALGSWIYRVHYGVHYALTCNVPAWRCGAGTAEDFSGLFDRITLFAFYLPYLALLELWLRRGKEYPP